MAIDRDLQAITEPLHCSMQWAYSCSLEVDILSADAASSERIAYLPANGIRKASGRESAAVAKLPHRNVGSLSQNL